MNGDPRLAAWREVLRIAIRAYLEALAGHWAQGDPSHEPSQAKRAAAAIGTVGAPSQTEVELVRELLDEQRGAPVPARLTVLAVVLGLRPGEEALAAAAWWAQADPQVAFAFGCAHDDGARRHASAALVRVLLEPFGIDVPPVVAETGRLVRGGVLQPPTGATEPMLPTPTASLVLAGQGPEALRTEDDCPARLQPARDGLVRHLQSADPGTVLLRGPAGIGRHAVAVAAARELGLVPVDGTRPARELALLARTGLALPIVAAAALDELDWETDDGPLVAIAPPGASSRGAHVVDLPAPAFSDREPQWRGALIAAGIDDGELVSALAARFAFTERDIREILRRALRDARWDGQPVDAGRIWDSARRQPEHALSRLAALIAPGFTLEDLVVDADCRAKLGELVAHVELQHIVLDRWGFRRRLPRGQGVIALFAGPSGTGKTMAAEAVAVALRHDLYRVDLSAVVSKYIGETEKNLSAAFDEAQRAGAVLFFDEADALFGKRTEVKDAHDRYANLEINYLLQRVETFTGLVILATNRQSALDEAFLRRLRFVIRFELPGAASRAELWRRSFPDAALREPIDWDDLAVAELSGGSIQGAALSAAYLAAGGDRAVTDADVEHAMRREFEKLGRAWPGRRNGVPT